MPTPKLSITSSNAKENGSNGVFTFQLDRPAPAGGLLVKFDTLGSTATLASDYTLSADSNLSALTANSFVIKAGASTASLTVQALNDQKVEAVENVKLNISVAAEGGTPSFANAVNYAMGNSTYSNNTYSVALADLNADGKADVVTANIHINTISVRLGQGNGSFASEKTYAVGSNPIKAVLADVNGDGRLDAVTANNNKISVLLGKGDGGFGAQTAFVMSARTRGVTLADLNHDGKLDVVTASASNNTIFVRLGLGNGSFAAETKFKTAGFTDGDIALADVNHDGNLDLIKTNSNKSNFSVLFGQGNGRFVNEATYATGSFPTGIALADLNGDGHQDVIISNWGSKTVSVRLGQANGQFLAEKTYATGAYPGYYLSVADINGDQQADVITANYGSANISVLLGNSDGSFKPQSTYATAASPIGVATSDLNGDGKLDIVSANNSSNNISVLLNTSTGGASQAVSKSLSITDNSINQVPTGTLAITGDTTQAQTLTATSTIADADGLGTLRYQWFANTVAITGATNSTYTLSQNEVGKTLSVKATYTDGNGNNESFSSEATAAIANLNDAPSGGVSINGTFKQGQLLTANASLADADGLGALMYQWFADNAAIKNATANSLVLNQALVNKTISVTASFTDGQGTAEQLSSATSAAVSNVNDLPKGTVSIDNTAPKPGDVLTASHTLTDADGLGAITYTWKSSGTVLGTGKTYLTTANDVGNRINVIASYSDGFGTAEAVASTATTAVWGNHLPTGTVSITNTQPKQGDTLTATNTLADAEGLGTFRYQWLADNSAIAGATATTYLLTQADVNKAFSVKISYTDGSGSLESVSSTATAAVRNVNDVPVGTLSIAGTTQQGQALTASQNITDADGFDANAISYQWFANGVAINSATNKSYMLTAADINKVMTVTARYTDAFGTNESLTSLPTELVTPVIKPDVVINAPDLSMDESGDTAVFSVQLTTPPTRDVLINFTGSDASEGALSNASLTFTSSNWSVPQAVTVTGQNDFIYDRDQPYIVSGQLTGDDVNYRQVVLNPMIFINHEDVTLSNDLGSQIPQGTPLDKALTIYGDAIIDASTVDTITGLFPTIGAKLTNDVMKGLDGADQLFGLNGQDDLSGGLGDDTLWGGYDSDFLYGNDGNDYLWGEQGTDKLQGGNGDDTLDGGVGLDSLIGGEGNDTYYLGYDALDVIDDQGVSADVDTVIMPYQLTSYTLPTNIENGAIAPGNSSSDLTGNTSDNHLTGNEGANNLNGLVGRDDLFGGMGDDTLVGGTGNDTLSGGAGKDTFTFDSALSSTDNITDFNTLDDRIQLDRAIFTKLTTAGVLNPAFFVIGTAAADLNDYMVYNKTSGALLYDADGAGAGVGFQIATLGINLALTNSDFAVV